jgi:DNA-binding transcriptional LysR family regulator
MRKEGSGTRNLIMNTLLEKNFDIDKLSITSHVESNESIKEMVHLGLGISFVSYVSIIDYLNNSKLKFYRIKDISFNRKFYFIYSKKKTFNPLEARFLNSICEYFNVDKK